MKALPIAIILGLCIGWIISLAIGSSGNETATSKTQRRLLPQDRQGISAPAATRAISARSLNDQRIGAHAGRPFNPYRDALVSRDLLASLGIEQLIEALRAGQITSREDIRSAFERIAELDPKRALALLEELDLGAENHALAQETTIKIWAKLDPDGLLSHIGSISAGGTQADFAYDLAMEWVSSDPQAAMSHLADLQGFTSMWRNRVSDGMLFVWAGKNIRAAEKWVEEKADPGLRDQMRDKLLAAHMRNLIGSDAIEFIRDRPENSTLQGMLASAYKSWSMTSAEDALKDVANQPEGDPAWGVTEEIGRAAMLKKFLFNGNVDDVIALKDLIPEGEAQREFLLGAANSASSNDLEATKKIISHLPESKERENALSFFTHLYMRKDPVALSKWLAELEPSPSRDSAVGSFARLLSKSDPQSARTWAETILDDKQRASVIEALGD